MALYSKIDRRIWVDAKFCALSQDAKLLWFYLLTCPENSSMPGLLRMGKASLAEALEWLPERLPKPFGELTRNGMAKANWEARFIYLPNSLKYNSPPNPNVVASWSDHWDNMPECDLKNEAFEAFSREMKRLGEPFAKRFAERLPKGSDLGIRNQEQDQDQDQDQEQDLICDGPESAARAKPVLAPKPPKPERPKKPFELMTGREQVIETYFAEYERCRGEKPPFGPREAKSADKLIGVLRGDHGRAMAVLRNAYADLYWQGKATINTIANEPAKFDGQVLQFDRKKPVVQSGGWQMDEEENERKLAEMGIK